MKLIYGLVMFLIAGLCSATPMKRDDINRSMESELCSPENVITLNAEYQVPKLEHYETEPDEFYEQCFKLTGYTYEVALLVYRPLVVIDDFIEISSYDPAGERDVEFLDVEDKMQNIFNVSDKFSGEVGEDMYIIVTAMPSDSEQRDVLVGYELHQNGNFMLSVSMAIYDYDSAGPNGQSTKMGKKNLKALKQTLLPPPQSSIELKNLGNCPSNALPPRDINFIIPLNQALGDVELQTTSYQTEDPGQWRAFASWFVDFGDKHDKYSPFSGVALAALSSSSRYLYNPEHFSFMLGASSAILGTGPFDAFSDIIKAEVDYDVFKMGRNYTRDIYLKDRERRHVKDSCYRDPMEGTCKRDYLEFSGYFESSSARATKGPIDFGDGVDLLVTVMTDGIIDFNMKGANSRDRILDAVGITPIFDQFEIINYDTTQQGLLTLGVNARRSLSDYGFHIGYFIDVECFPHEPEPDEN
ncbi:hypothetical protein L2750_13950 [Shewanella submarina]|uniref:Uncharacterized protein n=1 Tax=Shewanella submarina TaxID=2016376 RepID=A0ABV7GHZ0_9GAMM|nr:hypothetical protein [Shewanella submarina]MCL1038247.1 hypothetical protein [Shewanella submarina]